MSAPEEPPTIDPDKVPETLCAGRFNISVSPPLATITFTHVRPKIGSLIDEDKIVLESVVRARIVTTLDQLMAMRDVLNNIFKDNPTGATAHSGGSPKLN